MPLSDGMRPRRSPVVNVLIILANLAVWLFYELPHLDSYTLGFIFVLRVGAWIFLAVWFGYQVVEAHYGLTAARGHHGGTAFFARVGGFVFGVIAAAALVRAGKQLNVGARRGRLRLAT